jgi:hypothetical protein
MNRRSILAAIMGAAAAPQVVTAKIASEITGISLNPMPDGESLMAQGIGPTPSSWWGSPVQIAMEAKQSAERYRNEELPPHIRCMKSWSASYKATVFARELAAFEKFRREMQSSDDAMERIMAIISGRQS